MTASRATRPTAERDIVATLTEHPSADVLILGGGINGLATFRDLALQGVDVALVERGDYVSGASSASSHMIHGGIRYLENGEFRLVNEAVHERNRLLKNAPALRSPARDHHPDLHDLLGRACAHPFASCATGNAPPRARRPLDQDRAVIYDSFSRGGGSRAAARASSGARRSLAAAARSSNPTVKYTATYWDASLHDPERLALDVLLDGLATGAMAAPRTTPRSSGWRGRCPCSATLSAADEFAFSAQSVVINASGPWTDLTNLALGMPTRPHGRHQGLAYRARSPRAARGDGGPRAVLRERATAGSC